MEWFSFSFFANFSYWILAEELFAVSVLPRRADWLGRLVLALLGYFFAGAVVVALVNTVTGDARAYLPLFALFFGMTLLVWRFCLDASWNQVLFCCSSAYAVQHITYTLHQLLGDLLEAVGASWLVASMPYILVMRYVPYVLTGYLAHRFLMGQYQGIWHLKRGDSYAVGLSLAMLFVSLGLSSLTDAFAEGEAQVVCRLYAVLSCSLALALQFNLFSSDRSFAELERLEESARFGERQRRLSQDTVDAINRKCHDLKYRLAALRAEGDAAPGRDAALRDLENDVLIYDSLLETGNPTLDLVVAEKGLMCKQNGILLTVMADGSALGFMQAGDVYTLFGNAIDNAIEASAAVEEGRRNITLSLSRRAGVVVASVKNTCSGTVEFEDGLPARTSKGDALNHGFGTRSIRYIAERYGGEARMSQDGDEFTVLALFPQAM